MGKLRLTLPIPPSMNHCYFTAKNGMRIITKEGKLWIKNAQETTLVNIGDWVKTEKEKVVMEIHTYFPDKRRRDCHNTGKILYDALEGILYDDDMYLLPRYMDIYVDKENPRVELLIYKK